MRILKCKNIYAVYIHIYLLSSFFLTIHSTVYTRPWIYIEQCVVEPYVKDTESFIRGKYRVYSLCYILCLFL